MTMPNLYTPLNATILAVFGETAIALQDTGSVEVIGVFEDNYASENIGSNVRFTDRSHSLQILTEDVASTGIDVRKTLVIRDKRYQILSVEDDIDGMTLLALRSYT